ncbi:MAG: DUF3050 domain-containing protein [Janthinobacterium lividum]
MTHLEQLETTLRPLYAQLSAHPLYRSFTRMEDLHLFMETHVFAVWDFMSLLKTLQRGLTCVEVPWVPSRTPESRHLINEIVLGEESDVYEGRHTSHFELYCEAMRQCGASTAAADALITAIRNGQDAAQAIKQCGAPAEAVAFVRDTFYILKGSDLHGVAAAFTFGREDLIPEMFKGFVRDLNQELHDQLSTFIWYLERHIEVDGGEHGPMALRMVADLCGDDKAKWVEAERAAVFALESRIRLWNGIAARIAAAKS